MNVSIYGFDVPVGALVCMVLCVIVLIGCIAMSTVDSISEEVSAYGVIAAMALLAISASWYIAWEIYLIGFIASTIAMGLVKRNVYEWIAAKKRTITDAKRANALELWVITALVIAPLAFIVGAALYRLTLVRMIFDTIL